MAARVSLLTFIGITVGIIIAISLAWPFIAPNYNRLLIGTAGQLIPSGVSLSLTDMSNTIVISYEQHYSGLKRDLSTWIPGYALHFGLILVVALITATPGVNLIKRLKFIIIACASLFVIHIATILIVAEILTSYGYGTLNLFNNPLQILFITIGCDLFPAVTWVAICFKYLLRERKLNLTIGKVTANINSFPDNRHS